MSTDDPIQSEAPAKTDHQMSANKPEPESEPLTVDEGSSTNSPAQSSDASTSQSGQKSPSPNSITDAALLETDIVALTKAVASVSSKAARTVVCQNWRKCVIGSAHDESFLVRAILKNATPHVLERAMEEHGEKLLKAASAQMLDRAIELRLPTIVAKDLVTMLAKANRLGYDGMDVVDENEDVMPAQGVRDDSSSDVMEIEAPRPRDYTPVERLGSRQMQAVNGAPPTAMAVHSPQVVLPSRRKINGANGSKHVCQDCGASFAQSAGLKYHVEKRVCHKAAAQSASNEVKYWCESCKKGFTNSGGFKYHKENNVCGTHYTAKPTSPDAQLQQEQTSYVPPPQAGTPRLPQPFYSSHGSPNINGSPMNLPHRDLTQRSVQDLPHQNPPHHHMQLPLQQPHHHQPLPRQLPPPQPHPQYRSQYHPQPSQYAGGYPDFRVTVGNPALQTPVRQMSAGPTQQPSPASSPQLDPVSLAEMNSKLAKETERYERKMAEIPENLTAVDRDEEIQKIKRGHATRKSMIRKAYGIQVRKSKLRPANAVATPEGGLNVSVKGASGPETTPSFAPINRLAAFRASPATTPPETRHQISSSQVRPGPPLEGNEPKRRRFENYQSTDTPLPHVDHRGVQYSTRQNNDGLRTVDRETEGALDLANRTHQGEVLPSTVIPPRARKPLPTEPLPPSETKVDPVGATLAPAIIDRKISVNEPVADPRENDVEILEEFLPKRVPVDTAQKRWESLQPHKDAESPPPPAPIMTPKSPEAEIPSDSTRLTSLPSIQIPSGSESDSDGLEDIPARIPSPPRKRHTRSLSGSPALNNRITAAKPMARRISSPVVLAKTRATAKA